MGKRRTIIDAYKAAIAGVASLEVSQVVEGPPEPEAKGRTQYNVVPVSDVPERIDGGQQRRRMRLGIVAQIRVERRKASATEWEQLNDAWEAVEPVIEDLEENGVNGNALDVVVVEPGVEWDAYDDGDSFAVVGQQLDITYERDTGT